MKKEIIVLGAGGHARSVLDIALQNQEYTIKGCIAGADCGGDVLGVPVIGTDDDLEDVYRSGIHDAFIAIGDNVQRHGLYQKLKRMGFRFVNIISRSAILSPRVMLGTGICIMPGAVLNVNTVVGDSCIINTNCNIDHDCLIEEGCHIAPGVSMSGTVHIGRGTHIGTGSSVIEAARIGQWSYVGAGAAVVKDIPDHAMAYGVPAKIIRNIERK